MKTLFTAYLTDIPPVMRDEALDALANAVRAQFPAYRVVEWTKGDYAAAVWIEPLEREVTLDSGRVLQVPIPAHLNGWGHGSLNLKLVA